MDSTVGTEEKMEENWIKIDPHTHSQGVSMCSRISVEGIVDAKKKLGYDGAVLTNHCQPWYYPPKEHADYVERVLKEYEQGKAYAEKNGFRLWLGLEVSICDPWYADILLYGVTEKFLRETPCLYALHQRELFALCKQYGIVMVQAHPYRGSEKDSQRLLDERYLHGAELNCTPGDLERHDRIKQEGIEKGLLITCGTDYHGADNVYRGGIFVPEACRCAADLAEYLFTTKTTRIFKNGDEFFCPTPDNLRNK